MINQRLEVPDYPQVVVGWLIQNWIFVLLGLVFVWAVLFVPNFGTTINLSHLLTQLSVDGIIVIGMTILMIAWGIDLSVGSTQALAGIVYALFQSVGIPVAMLMGVVAGGLVGVANGLIVTKMKINFFITTLATMVAVRGIALTLSDGQPIYGAVNGFDWIGQHKVGAIELPVIVFAAIAIIGYIILSQTGLGRYWYAIGGNRQAAHQVGLNVDRYYTLAFAVTGLCAGLSGVVLASRASSASPAIGLETPLIVIAATVVGGTSLYGGIGTVPGAVAGLIIINIIRNLFNLSGVSPYSQYVVRGLILIAVVVVDAYLISRHREG